MAPSNLWWSVRVVVLVSFGLYLFLYHCFRRQPHVILKLTLFEQEVGLDGSQRTLPV